MRFDTHQAVGVGFGLATILVAETQGVSIPLVEMGTLVGASAVGALIPDIDHTKSKVSKKVPFFAWPIYLLNKFFGFLRDHSPRGLKKVFGYLAKGFGHRGFCHWPELWMALVYLSYLNLSGLRELILFGLSIGGFSHCVADTFNPGGIPWLLPFTFKRISLGNISTGSTKETVFKCMVILVDFAMLYTIWKGVM